jgi:hypothetical protein
MGKAEVLCNGLVEDAKRMWKVYATVRRDFVSCRDPPSCTREVTETIDRNYSRLIKWQTWNAEPAHGIPMKPAPPVIILFIYTSCAIIRVPKSLMPRAADRRTQTDWRSPSSTVAFIKILGALSFTVRPYSIAKSHTTRVATWLRPHPYVGSHGTAAPQQYGCWNAGAALSDPHCARVSSIEQKSIPGPEVG